jgi:hypothetical protein
VVVPLAAAPTASSPAYVSPRSSAAFSLAGVKYAALLTTITAVAGGQVYARAELVSGADGLYWSLTTMTISATATSPHHQTPARSSP